MVASTAANNDIGEPLFRLRPNEESNAYFNIVKMNYKSGSALSSVDIVVPEMDSHQLHKQPYSG